MNTQRTIYPNIPEDYAIKDGEELIYVLHAAGYSQREFADFMDKSKSHINDVCHGRSSFTLRHQQSLIYLLTPDLYCLAVIKGRQKLAEDREARQRAIDARMQAEQQAEEERLRRAEERRQSKIDELKRELGEDASSSYEDDEEDDDEDGAI